MIGRLAKIGIVGQFQTLHKISHRKNSFGELNWWNKQKQIFLVSIKKWICSFKTCFCAYFFPNYSSQYNLEMPSSSKKSLAIKKNSIKSCSLVLHTGKVIESEVFTGKSQSETLPTLLPNSKVAHSSFISRFETFAVWPYEDRNAPSLFELGRTPYLEDLVILLQPPEDLSIRPKITEI